MAVQFSVYWFTPLNVTYTKSLCVLSPAKPVVTKLSSSTSVTDGDTLELKCTGWGWPTPYTLWTREKIFDHIFGESDPGVTMFNVTTDQGLTIPRAGLRIEHMNASDQMTYMCLMVNEVGATNSTTYVRVKGAYSYQWLHDRKSNTARQTLDNVGNL